MICSRFLGAGVVSPSVYHPAQKRFDSLVSGQRGSNDRTTARAWNHRPSLRAFLLTTGMRAEVWDRPPLVATTCFLQRRVVRLLLLLLFFIFCFWLLLWLLRGCVFDLFVHSLVRLHIYLFSIFFLLSLSSPPLIWQILFFDIQKWVMHISSPLILISGTALLGGVVLGWLAHTRAQFWWIFMRNNVSFYWLACSWLVTSFLVSALLLIDCCRSVFASRKNFPPTN